LLGLLLLTIAIAAGEACAAAPPGQYSIVERVPGPPLDSWDYAAVDPATRRLYLASEGVAILELDSGKVSRYRTDGAMTHAVLPLGNGRVAVSDGRRHTVSLRDGGSWKLLADIPTGKPPTAQGWHNPDGLVLEPKTGLLIVVNGDSGALVLVDPSTQVAVGQIAVGGRLEAAAADGNGRVYVNVESRNSIATVDIERRKLIQKASLKDCEEPTGLAYDPGLALLMSVCGNGVAKFVRADNLVETASVQVGRGADAIMFDAARHMAFIAAGEDGTLSVLAVRGAADVSLVQTLHTQPGTRLGIIDEKTGSLYLPTVKLDLNAPPIKLPGLPPFPAAIASSFEFWIVGLPPESR
jgi:DNA-binding beta-propeller fold protein YncE